MMIIQIDGWDLNLMLKLSLGTSSSPICRSLARFWPFVCANRMIVCSRMIGECPILLDMAKGQEYLNAGLLIINTEVFKFLTRLRDQGCSSLSLLLIIQCELRLSQREIASLVY